MGLERCGHDFKPAKTAKTAKTAVLKIGLGLGGENHATKTNFTAEPIPAPPALCILS
ncbi:hypothetical protein LPA06_00180 [Lacticaseibacillus paracasei subsp. tolerans]|nr:hypothetical protein LPA06_00180 [Lacticaseibacillus paracasei subsp. tolerans]